MSDLAAGLGLVLVLVLLLSVLGAVERRERVWFVVGVLLLVVGTSLAAGGSLAGALGAAMAVGGFVAIAASVVPLVRQSPTTA